MQKLFKRDKYKELIVHVVQSVGHFQNVGATVINKILVDCDFTAFRELGVPMTGQKVQHENFGPISTAFQPVTREMEDFDGVLVSWVNIDKQRKYKVNRNADLTAFSEEEKAVIESCIARWSKLNATQASEESHQYFGGWVFTDNGEEIPYETAWISMRPLSQADKDYALELLPA